MVAASHYSRQRWRLAEKEFAIFLEAFPGHARIADATFFLAETLIQLRDYEKSLPYYLDYTQRFSTGPHHRQALFRLGEASYLADKYAESDEYLTRFAHDFPGDKLSSYALMYLAEMALRNRNHSAAKEHFENALQRSPPEELSNRCRLGLARVDELLGNIDKALADYRTLVTADAGALSAQASLRLGALLYAQNRHQEAAQELESFERCFPTSSLINRALLGYGCALYGLEDFPAARRVFSELTHDPDVGLEAAYWLGTTERALGNSTIAAEILLAAAQDAAQESHVLAPAIQYQAGEALWEAGRSDEAAESLRDVISRWEETRWAEASLWRLLQQTLDESNRAGAEELAGEYLERFPRGSQRAEAAAIVARGHIRSDRHQNAIPYLKKMTADLPPGEGDSWPWTALVSCYVAVNQIDEAQHAYRRLRDSKPEPDSLRPITYSLAEAAYQAGQYSFAIELYESLVEEADSSDFVGKGLSGRAWCQLQLNRPREAAETFGVLARDHPQHALTPQALVTRAKILAQLDLDDIALQAYEKVFTEYKDKPETASALFQAARLCQSIKLVDKSCELFVRFIDEFPDHDDRPRALYELAWLEQDRGNTERAAIYFRRIHEEYPDGELWADATYRLAEIEFHQSRLDVAEKAAVQLAQDAGKYPDLAPYALYLLGQIQIARGQWQKAIEPLQRLRNEHPKTELRTRTEYWLAESYFRAGLHEEAETTFHSMSTVVDDDEVWAPMIPLRHAQSLAHLGKWAKAQQVAESISRRFPDFNQSFEVDYLLGRCYAMRGEFDRSRDSFSAVLQSRQAENTETAAMAQWMIGETFFHQRNYEEAIRAYLRVTILYVYPRWQSAALLQAGKCHERMDQPREASKLYEQLLQELPVSEFHDEARWRLTSLDERLASGKRKLPSHHDR